MDRIIEWEEDYLETLRALRLSQAKSEVNILLRNFRPLVPHHAGYREISSSRFRNIAHSHEKPQVSPVSLRKPLD